MDLFGLFRSKPLASSEPMTAAPPPAIAAGLEPALSPADLRRRLFDAATGSDAPGRLEDLCRAHSHEIVEHADEWMSVPRELQSNPAALRWYRDGLRAIAGVCAETLEQPEFYRRLTEALGPSGPATAHEVSEVPALDRATGESLAS